MQTKDQAYNGEAVDTTYQDNNGHRYLMLK